MYFSRNFQCLSMYHNSTVEGQNAGTPVLLIIPEGVRAGSGPGPGSGSGPGPSVAAARCAAAISSPGPDPNPGLGPDPGPGAFRND